MKDDERQFQIKQLAMRMHGRSARADAWWAVEEMWENGNATEKSLYLDCARIAFDWLIRPQTDVDDGYLHTRINGVRVRIELDNR